MASTPENKSSFHPEAFSLGESVFDHTMLLTLFAAVLVTHPREALKVLTEEGPKGIARNYGRFFDINRPILYYFEPKQ